MTQKEIFKFNERCAEFLGYENTTPTDKAFNIFQNTGNVTIGDKEIELLETMSMQFHSNWDWIMAVKSKICQLDIIDGFITYYDSFQGYKCGIEPRYRNTFEAFDTEIMRSEKEAVLQAIILFFKNCSEKFFK